MTTRKHKFLFVAFGLACLAAGCLAVPVVLSAAMFNPIAILFVCAAFLLVAGSSLSAYAAFRAPFVWFVWPLLFGGPMFFFGMSAGFSPPDPASLLLWRSLAIAFVLVPGLAAFLGGTRQSGPAN